MSTEIKLNYNSVYDQTASLMGQIDAAMTDMDSKYQQLSPQIDQTDGAANAALKDSVASNQAKARITAETLKKLLSFMSNSTKNMEELDAEIGRFFQTNSSMTQGR